MNLSEVAAAVGGKLLMGDAGALLPEVSIDSRRIQRGQVFLPIRGDRFEGQSFIEEAIRGGAAGFFTEEWSGELADRVRAAESALMVVQVDNGNKALMDLARLARGKMTAKVIGITGSAGKTSTKHLLAAALGMEKRVYASPASYNNEVGGPLTVLGAPADVQCLIVEMGMRGAGQIAELAAMVEPHIGVITNIGRAHIGVAGGEEGILAAKSELLDSLDESGVAVINADDGYAPALAACCKAAVLTFGLHPSADFRADDIRLDEQARPSFLLHTPTESGEIRLRTRGRHWVPNALAAAAAASAAGVSFPGIQAGLGSVEAPPMRMERLLIGGMTVLNDSYNANPASMTAALETLRDTEGPGKRVAVLGDMAELGEFAEEAHAEIGAVVAAGGIDILVGIGPWSKVTVEAAGKQGMPGRSAEWFATLDEAAVRLRSVLEPGDTVLFKASRAMGLERLIDMLTT